MSGRNWWIRGGHVVDPRGVIDRVADVLILDGRIAAVGDVEHEPDCDRLRQVDATGKLVTPAWIDVHVHLRDPGYPDKETVATGTAAAAAGGFATIACMPNTDPALDSPGVLQALGRNVEAEGVVQVLPIASITRDRRGKAPVDFDALVAAGAVGFSDDGDTTSNSGIMRQALEASRRLNRPVMVHCEDKALASGAMHEGEVSRELGIPGIPAAAEEIIIARDLMLAELTGGWLHVCHVSTERGAALIAGARKRGVRVTAEVMPHHLVMSDQWVAGERELHNTQEEQGLSVRPGDPDTKVNPPLRPVAETTALLTAVREGVFDCFATDHAPHAAPEKGGSRFEDAAFGLSGLELAFPLTYALVRAGHVSLTELVRLWTLEPARILQIERGTLAPGSVADVAVFDPDDAWTVTPERLKTKSANTPLLGMTLRGRALLTLVGGEERHNG